MHTSRRDTQVRGRLSGQHLCRPQDGPAALAGRVGELCLGLGPAGTEDWPNAFTSRAHLLALGSGDPTRAVCSTLIAEAFQSIRYPILPISIEGQTALFRRRHHILFTPRDFDLSPWFDVVKPRLLDGFDPHELHWQETA